jgi:2'-5' RNA ligase
MSRRDRTTSTVQLDVPAALPLQEAVADVPGVTLLAPPHISLAWHWLPADHAVVHASLLAALVERTPAFPLRFDRLAAFPPDGRGRVVVHAQPEPVEPIRALAAAVWALADEPPPEPDWTPHLSVGRVPRGGPVAEVLQRAAAALPIETSADAVHLHVHDRLRWEVAGVFRLAARS